MALLLRLELIQIKNGLRGLSGNPWRLAGGLVIGACLLVSIGAQLLLLVLPVPPEPELMGELFGQRGDRLGAFLFGFLLLGTYNVVSQGLQGGLLAFSPAEMDVLFAAPLPRRTVLAYKVCRDHLRLFGFTCFVLLVLAPQAKVAGAQHVPEMWAVTPWGIWLYLVLLSNLSHLLHVVLTYGASSRRWLPLTVRAAFGALAVLLVAAVGTRPTGADWAVWLAAQFRGGPLAWALGPLALAWQMLMVPFDGLPPAVATKLLGLLALAAGSLWALVRRRENLYEPTLGTSAFRAQYRAAMRSGNWQAAQALLLQRRSDTGSGRRLPPFGRGAGVLLWRVLATTPGARGRRLLLAGAMAVAVPALMVGFCRQVQLTEFLRLAPFVYAYLAFVMGLALFRVQQGELRRVDLLRPLPLPGWAVLLAQALPAVVGLGVWFGVSLTAMAWLAPEADPRLVTTVALGLLGYLGLLAAANLLAALIFPSAGDPLHQAVGNLGLMLGTSLLATPGVVVGAWCRWQGWTGCSAGLAAGATMAAPAVLLFGLAVWAWQRFDPTR